MQVKSHISIRAKRHIQNGAKATRTWLCCHVAPLLHGKTRPRAQARERTRTTPGHFFFVCLITGWVCYWPLHGPLLFQLTPLLNRRAEKKRRKCSPFVSVVRERGKRSVVRTEGGYSIVSSLRMTGEGKGAENRFGHCYQSRKRLPWINSNASVNQAAPVHHPLTPRITPRGWAFFFRWMANSRGGQTLSFQTLRKCGWRSVACVQNPPPPSPLFAGVYVQSRLFVVPV